MMQKAHLHTITNLRALKPLLLLLLFSSLSSEMWGGTVTLTVTAESSPSTGGYVYVNTRKSAPNSYSLTSDYATQNGTSIGTSWTGYTTVSKDFYLYAKSINNDYSFKGWSKDAASTSVDTSNPKKVTLSGKNNDNKSDGPYYAIFTKYKTTTTEIDFGEVAYNPGVTTSHTFTIDCHNVGTWSNPSGLSGVFSASLSGNSNDNSQQTCTVTVTLDPKSLGTVSQTLKVTTVRGGDINVTVKAKVTTTYYGRAQANSDPAVGGGVFVKCGSSATPEYATSKTSDWSKSGLTAATKTTAYYYAQESDGYEFVGWYTGTSGSGTEKSSNLSYSEEFDVSSIDNEKPTTITRYAYFEALQYYYFKAQANKVGEGTVYASFVNNTFLSATATSSERATTLAQTQSAGTPTAYFKAVESNANYHFAGWYTDAECTDANRVSTDPEYSVTMGHSTQTSEATALTQTLYAKFVQELTPEITATGYTDTNPKTMKVGDDIESAFSFLNTSPIGSGLTVISSNTSVLVYDDGLNKISAVGEGTATITFTQSYTGVIKAKTFTFNFSVSRVENTLALNTSSDTKYVTQTVDNVLNLSTKNSTADIETSSSVAGMSNDDAAKIAYYDVANNKIVIPNSQSESFTTKEVTIKIWQEQNVKYTASGEKTFTLTVNKYQTSFFGSAYNLMVDGTQTADYSYKNTSAATPTNDSNDDFYYTIDDISYTNQAKNKKYNSLDSLVRFTPSTKEIKALNAGTGKITLHQKETYKFTGAEQSFNITVSKHANTLSCEGGWGKNMYLDSEMNVSFTADNEDYANSKIEVDQLSGNNPGSIVATYSNNKISSYYNTGSATWRVSQPENYKYEAAKPETLSVSVNLKEETICYLKDTLTDEEGSTVEEIGTVDLGGVGDVLTFQMKWNGTKYGNDAIFYTSPDNIAWDNGQKISASSEEHGLIFKYSAYDDEENSKTITLPEGTRFIRFETYNEGVFTDNPKVRHIKVTRKTWLDVPDITITTQVDERTLVYPRTEGKGILTIDYSLANGGGPLMIACDNGKFSFTDERKTSSVELSNYECSTGSVEIPVYYSSEVAGTDTAHIVIYNKVYRTTATITGETQDAATPMLIWNIGNDLYSESTYGKFIESTDSETEITFNKIVPSNLLTVSGDIASGYVLKVDKVDSEKQGYIIVSQGELQDSLPVKIHLREGACLSFIPKKSDDFNNAKVESTKDVSWCSKDQKGYHNNVVSALGINIPFVDEEDIDIDVRYSQEIGIALGTYLDGLEKLKGAIKKVIGGVFTGGSTEFQYTPRYVDLAFDGIPDSIHFEAKVQTVTSIAPAFGDLLNVTWPATVTTWKLYQKSNSNDSYGEPIEFNTTDSTIDLDLNPATRYVRIEYGGNFTGFVKNLEITRKKRFKVETPDGDGLVFGKDGHSLQEPQTIKLSYSSLNSCGENLPISIVSTDSAFYVDKTSIHQNVGVNDSTTISVEVNVRCTDVGRTGQWLKFMLGDEALDSISLESGTPIITSEGTSMFHTGTEYDGKEEASDNHPYRKFEAHDFATCFDGVNARFDSLYIYGVSASAPDENNNRSWKTGYNKPAINLEDGNVHTPCFVYAKDQNDDSQYIYERTFDAATTTLNISTTDAEKKLAFMGYKPAKLNGDPIPAIKISGNKPASIYLDSTEILASGAVLELNGVIDTIYARGNNILTSNSDATVKFVSSSSELVIEDNWINEPSGFVALNAAVEKPSIQLNSANDSVIIRGSQLQLHNNANRMAIACTEDIHKGFVHIYDGTITGTTDTLGLPLKSLIDGGTFNNYPAYVYRKGKLVRPWNSRGELLERYTMSKTDLYNKYRWYGQNHLQSVSSLVYPMLLGEKVCIFTGQKDSLASEPGNWNKKPDSGNDIIIDSAIVITESMNVNTVFIREKEGKDVSVTIAPTGGLTVGKGGIIGATTKNLILAAGDANAVDKEKNSVTGQTGFLRIDPKCEEPMPEATVQLFSIGFYDLRNQASGSDAAFQYVGAPVMDNLSAKDIFTRSWIYDYIDSTDQWVNNRADLVMEPFVGYATTQFDSKEGKLITYTGHIVNNSGVKTIDLIYTETNGNNLLANSYTAPIDITKFEHDDFVNVEKTIYIFNTGSKNQAENKEQTRGSLAGQYTTISSNTKGMQVFDEPTPSVIAPMQGFFVKAVEGDGRKVHQLKLDYERLVWGGTHTNTPLRAPKRNAIDKDDAVISGSMKVTLSADGWCDKVYLLESEQYEETYEDGYDAHKMESGSLNVFTMHENEKFAIDATNSITGTRLGVRTGAETTYTMYFSSLNGEHEWTLVDNETSQEIDIVEDTEYTFNAVPNSTLTNRFVISERAVAPSTPTGVGGAEAGVKVQKFIKDNQMYILKNGVLYNAQGKVVR